MEPLTFLESVAGYNQQIEKGASASASSPIRLAVIDPAYVQSSYPGTLPKVTFEGESTLTDKRYAVAGDYLPRPSDRVVMLPVGHTYVILGGINLPGPIPPGTITGYGGSSAPTGWLICDGSVVSRTTYKALFDAIGTAYGAGDGSTTFGIPDLRQRFPLGKAASGTGATLGGTGGAIDHAHALDTTSSHARLALSGASPQIKVLRKTTDSWTHTHEQTGSNASSGSASNTIGIGLGGDSDVANPPFQTMNFIVKI